MVQVGIMLMPVHHRRMAMPMRVRFARRVAGPMCMLMVLVVHMTMLMFYRLMGVFVDVPFGEMKVNPNRHEHAGAEELDGHGLIEQRNGDDCSEERRRREIGARPEPEPR